VKHFTIRRETFYLRRDLDERVRQGVCLAMDWRARLARFAHGEGRRAGCLVCYCDLSAQLDVFPGDSFNGKHVAYILESGEDLGERPHSNIYCTIGLNLD